jgi:DNA-binding transcriptional regulator YdaS (Cro superfamily)
MGLKEYIFMKDLSIKNFSKILDCSRSYLSRVVRGKIKPSSKFARQIEKATEGKVTKEEVLNVSK